MYSCQWELALLSPFLFCRPQCGTGYVAKETRYGRGDATSLLSTFFNAFLSIALPGPAVVAFCSHLLPGREN